MGRREASTGTAAAYCGTSRAPSVAFISVIFLPNTTDARPFAINVLRIESGLVADMDWFIYPELFPAFGLPDTLR